MIVGLKTYEDEKGRRMTGRKALPPLTSLSTSQSVELSLFNELRRIEQGWRRRLRQREERSKRPPWDTASGFLKREIYRLTNHFVSHHEGDAIQKRVSDLHRAPASGPSFEENPYHWTFLALQPGQQTISRADRRLFANQLLYARQNEVPEAFLVGFIYQCDLNGNSLFERVRSGAKEPVLLPDLPVTDEGVLDELAEQITKKSSFTRRPK